MKGYIVFHKLKNFENKLNEFLMEKMSMTVTFHEWPPQGKLIHLDHEIKVSCQTQPNGTPVSFPLLESSQRDEHEQPEYDEQKFDQLVQAIFTEQFWLPKKEEALRQWKELQQKMDAALRDRLSGVQPRQLQNNEQVIEMSIQVLGSIDIISDVLQMPTEVLGEVLSDFLPFITNAWKKFEGRGLNQAQLVHAILTQLWEKDLYQEMYQKQRTSDPY